MTSVRSSFFLKISRGCAGFSNVKPGQRTFNPQADSAKWSLGARKGFSFSCLAAIPQQGPWTQGCTTGSCQARARQYDNLLQQSTYRERSSSFTTEEICQMLKAAKINLLIRQVSRMPGICGSFYIRIVHTAIFWMEYVYSSVPLYVWLNCRNKTILFSQ